MTHNTTFIQCSIGPSFEYELREAGLDHLALSFNANGVLLLNDTNAADLTAINTLIDKHDASTPDPYLYRQQRAQAYPALSDQLDEFMKWVANESSITFPPALKDIANECMNVKTTYPKPE
jgi:hypothetical protein